MGVISLNSQKFIAETLMPALFEHLHVKELYHSQLLYPNEIFSKVSGTNINNKVGHTTEIEMIQFSDREEMKKQLIKWMLLF
jgi:hypothetical protein